MFFLFNIPNICFKSLLLFKYFFILDLNYFLLCFLRNINANNILYSDNTELKIK